MIEIVAAQPAWASEHRQWAAAIQRCLGEVALAIEPIGSTAVPGLAAKDILDVMAVVESLEPAERIRAPLEAAGFVFRDGTREDHVPPGGSEDPAEWSKLYFDGPPDARSIHLHVRELGRSNTRFALLMRDYLRATPEAALAYAEFKRRLCGLAGEDRGAYSDAKDPVCDLIVVAAEAWGRASRWTLPVRHG